MSDFETDINPMSSGFLLNRSSEQVTYSSFYHQRSFLQLFHVVSNVVQQVCNHKLGIKFRSHFLYVFMIVPYWFCKLITKEWERMRHVFWETYIINIYLVSVFKCILWPSFEKQSNTSSKTNTTYIIVLIHKHR